MASRTTKRASVIGRRSQVHVTPNRTSTGPDIPLVSTQSRQHPSMFDYADLTNPKKSTISYNGSEYQLMPVEIEKDAEIGLVLGQIENENWMFIDEILPNGMIDIHGILKEGDFLIQAGNYSLIGTNIPTALLLIERAYEEGRKTISFVAAREIKTTDAPRTKSASQKKEVEPMQEPVSRNTRAQSFVSYENEEEELEEPGQSTNEKGKYTVEETRF